MKLLVLGAALAVCAFVLNLQQVAGDIPVHCLFHQVFGDWKFTLTPAQYSNDVVHNTCSMTSALPNTANTTLNLRLLAPDVAYDDQGNQGFWTLIYDQGMEIVINKQKYFAFFNYTQKGQVVTSNCGQTFTGWYHDAVIAAKRFGCFRGVRVGAPSESVSTHIEPVRANLHEKIFVNNAEKINSINKSQKLWKAKAYPQFEGKTFAELRRIAGRHVPKFRKDALKIQKQKIQSMFPTQTRHRGQKKVITEEDIKALPTEFSWTNVNGKDYVVPVRDQGQCGSCYAFSTSDMFGSRVRVATNGTKQPVYSPQDIVDCSAYSQGCDGGFMYLVSKYAEDYGLTLESCDPYLGQDGTCRNYCPSIKRDFGTNYAYCGGFYGATNEKNMMYDLYHGGPVAIAFEVFDDFFNYHSGVYTHKTASDLKLNDPHWEQTNHAVLLVGWGVENGTPYWLVKNSWGTGWGINGYFKIKRGVDECDCESEAVVADPVL
ncbi:hypothetical protein C9374_007338 [Naegleria lovaniensis]|uniref:Dipeptidyl peptidase 1 n=1 Tax=Naegleria lovaniensis TaxID=51637 RepID=A0AA88KLR5_NAELO|nr:uncharacterized protein C9374_007338 [Naegleria lovaniensis]KAG2379199.1 hypothetical protein C9374_007338 [Naegleria lovaniensis]